MKIYRQHMSKQRRKLAILCFSEWIVSRRPPEKRRMPAPDSSCSFIIRTSLFAYMLYPIQTTLVWTNILHMRGPWAPRARAPRTNGFQRASGSKWPMAPLGHIRASLGSHGNPPLGSLGNPPWDPIYISFMELELKVCHFHHLLWNFHPDEKSSKCFFETYVN